MSRVVLFICKGGKLVKKKDEFYLFLFLTLLFFTYVITKGWKLL